MSHCRYIHSHCSHLLFFLQSVCHVIKVVHIKVNWKIVHIFWFVTMNKPRHDRPRSEAPLFRSHLFKCYFFPFSSWLTFSPTLVEWFNKKAFLCSNLVNGDQLHVKWSFLLKPQGVEKGLVPIFGHNFAFHVYNKLWEYWEWWGVELESPASLVPC